MAQFTPDQADALANAMKKSLVEQKDSLIGISEASDKVTSSLGGMLNSYAAISKKSNLWNIMSRMVSGVLPGFWSLQNKVRAVGLAVHMWNEQTEKALEEQSKFIEKVAESDETVTRLTNTINDLNDVKDKGASDRLKELKDWGSYLKFYGREEAVIRLLAIYEKKRNTEKKNQIKLDKQSFKIRLKGMSDEKKQKLLQSLGTQGFMAEKIRGRTRQQHAAYGKFEKLGEKKTRNPFVNLEDFLPKVMKGWVHKTTRDMRSQKIISKMFKGNEKGQAAFVDFMEKFDPTKGITKNIAGSLVRAFVASRVIGAIFKVDWRKNFAAAKGFKEKMGAIFNGKGIKNLAKGGFDKILKGLKVIVSGWLKMMIVIGKVLLALTLFGLFMWGLRESGLLDKLKDSIIWFKDKAWPKIWEGLQLAWSGIQDMLTGIYNLITGSGDNSLWENLMLIFGGYLDFGLGTAKVILITVGGLLWGIVKVFGQGLWDTGVAMVNGEWGKAGKIFGKWATTILMLLVVGIGLWAIVASGVSVMTAGLAMAGAAVLIGGAGSEIDKFASGGNSTGGMALVGERGPEFVNLPKGARVHSNAESRKMGGNNITINVQGRVGASDVELRDIAKKIGRMISSDINRSTSSSTIYR